MSKKKNKTKYSALRTVIFCAFFAYVGYTLIVQQISINDKKAQLKEIDSQIVHAQEEKEELAEQLELVNTPEYIEKVAREELGYAEPDEIVFVDATSQN